ncbi:unnamed protein product [Peniophora sp. CBMAI 1063]|nr:unnamed protein product [Peniophora sp. CBMAI 1063]
MPRSKGLLKQSGIVKKRRSPPINHTGDHAIERVLLLEDNLRELSTSETREYESRRQAPNDTGRWQHVSEADICGGGRPAQRPSRLAATNNYHPAALVLEDATLVLEAADMDMMDVSSTETQMNNSIADLTFSVNQRTEVDQPALSTLDDSSFEDLLSFLNTSGSQSATFPVSSGLGGVTLDVPPLYDLPGRGTAFLSQDPSGSDSTAFFSSPLLTSEGNHQAIDMLLPSGLAAVSNGEAFAPGALQIQSGGFTSQGSSDLLDVFSAPHDVGIYDTNTNQHQGFAGPGPSTSIASASQGEDFAGVSQDCSGLETFFSSCNMEDGTPQATNTLSYSWGSTVDDANIISTTSSIPFNNYVGGTSAPSAANADALYASGSAEITIEMGVHPPVNEFLDGNDGTELTGDVSLSGLFDIMEPTQRLDHVWAGFGDHEICGSTPGP